MSTYLDVDGFRLRTAMPLEDVDDLEQRFPGFLAARLAVASSEITSRLRKRYSAPFAAPVPEVVLGWLVALVTPVAYLRRGVNPADEQFASIVEEAKLAREQMKEAADAEEGLFDLPLRADTTTSGISQGGPMVYSEASPYEWTDVQAEVIRGR